MLQLSVTSVKCLWPLSLVLVLHVSLDGGEGGGPGEGEHDGGEGLEGAVHGGGGVVHLWLFSLTFLVELIIGSFESNEK
jgi:hypothetical protein